jgi:hypothetical protein
MSNTSTSNGSQRKSLAQQLDRLDSIIDALAEGLNEAVADVVRQAVSAAVQQSVEAVLREVLGRPELLRALAGQPAVPVAQVAPAPVAVASGPSLPRRACSWVWNKVSGAASSFWDMATQKALVLALLAVLLFHKARQSGERAGSALWAGVCWVGQHPLVVLLALVTGLVLGVGAYLTGPLVASVVTGVAGLLTSLVPAFRLLHGCEGVEGEE